MAAATGRAQRPRDAAVVGGVGGASRDTGLILGAASGVGRETADDDQTGAARRARRIKAAELIEMIRIAFQVSVHGPHHHPIGQGHGVDGKQLGEQWKRSHGGNSLTPVGRRV